MVGGGWIPGRRVLTSYCPRARVQVMVVEGVDPSDASTFLKECAVGARGYLVTRGRHLMAGYVQGEEATRKYVVVLMWWTEAGGA